MKHRAHILLALVGIFVLTACNSGGEFSTGISGSSGGGTDPVGLLTLSITDAPIDDASEVVVQVDAVELQPAAGPASGPASGPAPGPAPITIPLVPPKNIDLMVLQGLNSEPLFEDQILPAGNYNWIRLIISAVRDGVWDSYVVLSDGTVYELDMPGNSEKGLQINNPPRIAANRSANMTIDVNLRKSLNRNGGDYEFTPALSLVQDELTGSIRGTVKLSTLTDAKDCSDTDPETGNAVYLFKGFNAKPDDFGSLGEAEYSAFVTLNPATGKYEYEFGFIPFGDYTAAFTCMADLDEPDIDDGIVFSKKTKNVQVFNATPKTIPGNTFR